MAGFVLVLHNLTPHIHAVEHSDERPSNLTDLLEFAFSIDPGAGHLECFSQAEPVDMNQASELFVAILPEKDIQLVRDEFLQDLEAVLIAYKDPPDYRQMAPRPPPRFV